MGAFSIDPGCRASVKESLDYTAEVLRQTDSYTVMYPQGEIVPQDTARLVFQRGLLVVLRKVEVPVTLLPVIFLVKPYNERHPELWGRFGEPWSADAVREDFTGFETAANRERTELQESIRARNYSQDILGTRALRLSRPR
jgi:hypothetical protein